MREFIKRLIKVIIPVDYVKVMRVFHCDASRIVAYGGAFHPKGKVALEASIILRYHVLEKGLTMPQRHVPFGKKIATQLLVLVCEFQRTYGLTSQVEHAISVLKEYEEVHRTNDATDKTDAFWNELHAFIVKHDEIPISRQSHYKKAEFYSKLESPFPEFAMSRHTIRNYSAKPVDISEIKKAVELAMSAPTACNRQQVRVHCVVDKKLRGDVLALQGGNRGFGHLADKVLIVTCDLGAEFGGLRERFDPYVNGGIVVMNLCYSLHYYKIAHCILTCAMDPEKESELRRMCSIPDHEVVVSMMCCGNAPEEFDVASSPRRDIDEVFSVVR